MFLRFQRALSRPATPRLQNAHGSRNVLVSLLHDRSTCVSLSLQPQLNAWGFKLTWPFRNVRFAARLSPCLTLPPRLRALRPLKKTGVVTGMYKRCFMNYSAQNSDSKLLTVDSDSVRYCASSLEVIITASLG